MKRGSGAIIAEAIGARESSASALFAIVWNEISEVLGTAAAAAIVRRTAGRAAPEHPELAELVVARSELEYSYSLPPAWSQKSDRVPPAFQALVAEIGRLLLEMTGTVLVRRLEEIPELRARGLVWRREKAN